MKTILGAPWPRYLPAIVVLAFAVFALVMTYQLPVGARAMPTIVAWTALVLGLIDLASRTGGRGGREMMRLLNPAGLQTAPTEETQTHAEPQKQPGIRDMAIGMGLIVALVISFLLLGVLPTTAIIVCGALLIAYPRQFLLDAFIAGATTLGVWLLFAVLLRLQLYPGLLFGGVL